MWCSRGMARLLTTLLPQFALPFHEMSPVPGVYVTRYIHLITFHIQVNSSTCVFRDMWCSRGMARLLPTLLPQFALPFHEMSPVPGVYVTRYIHLITFHIQVNSSTCVFRDMWCSRGMARLLTTLLPQFALPFHEMSPVPGVYVTRYIHLITFHIQVNSSTCVFREMWCSRGMARLLRTLPSQFVLPFHEMNPVPGVYVTRWIHLINFHIQVNSSTCVLGRCGVQEVWHGCYQLSFLSLLFLFKRWALSQVCR